MIQEPLLAGLSSWTSRLTATNKEELAVGAALFVGTMVGSAILAIVILCRLPVDYLRSDPPSLSAQGHPAWKRIFLRIGKNLFGVLLVVAGAVMSIPGVPGQGLLTILIGVMLLDFPGKLAFERRLINRPSVLRNINRIRVRFRREALLPGEDEAPKAPGG